jgi:hypothetical protein
MLTLAVLQPTSDHVQLVLRGGVVARLRSDLIEHADA